MLILEDVSQTANSQQMSMMKSLQVPNWSERVPVEPGQGMLRQTSVFHSPPNYHSRDYILKREQNDISLHSLLAPGSLHALLHASKLFSNVFSFC